MRREPFWGEAGLSGFHPELFLVEILLRPLTPDDAPRLAELANNFNIWKFIRDHLPHPYHLSDAERFIQHYSPNSTNPLRRAIHLDGAGFCGMIGLHPGSDVNRFTAEIGYWIGEPYWGRGIASAAVGQMVDLGFTKLDIERIYAGVYSNNPASMRVLERNGFQFEGISRRAVFKNGEFLDEHRFGRLRA